MRTKSTSVWSWSCWRTPDPTSPRVALTSFGGHTVTASVILPTPHGTSILPLGARAEVAHAETMTEKTSRM